MALALAQYKDLFEVVRGYLYGARGVCFGLDIVRPLSVSVQDACRCACRKGSPTFAGQRNLAALTWTLTEQMMNTDDTDNKDAH